MDETYIKLKGKLTYLYRVVDSEGNTVDFLLRKPRDIEAAKAFFTKAFKENKALKKVSIDKNSSNKTALDSGEISTINSSSGVQIKSEVQKNINQEVDIIKRIEILASGSNFFDSIINPPIDGDLPFISVILDYFSINFLLDQYQSNSQNQLIFGCVEPIKIKEETLIAFSDEKKERLYLSKEVLKEVFPDEKQIYSFNEVKNVIDQKIDKYSLEKTLMLARSFRHIKRGDEKYPNQLGDYIAEYILISAIKKHEADNIMNKEKRKWLSEALYELSQTYSHLIDYHKIKFNELNFGHLVINSNYIKSKKTRNREINNYELNNTCFKFEFVIFHKLNLLKLSLIYNNKNLNAANRLLEYIYYDIENMLDNYVSFDNKFYNSLISDFKYLDLGIVMYLYRSFFQKIFDDNDVVKVAYKTEIVNFKFLNSYEKLLLQEIENVKSSQKEVERKKSVPLIGNRTQDASIENDKKYKI